MCFVKEDFYLIADLAKNGFIHADGSLRFVFQIKKHNFLERLTVAELKCLKLEKDLAVAESKCLKLEEDLTLAKMTAQQNLLQTQKEQTSEKETLKMAELEF